MNKKQICLALVALVALGVAWPGGARGSAEAAAAGSSSGGGRGKYLAAEGIIIPAEEVYVASYIAAVDYKYPFPSEAVGVTLYSGHHQVSSAGQREIVQIGIQGGKSAFEDLPPMNLAFVIDKSGSMSAANKMDWVKDAFGIFIERVRDIDFVSLVVFDNEAGVVFPSTQMNSQTRRMQFKDRVAAVSPGGGTNLVAGLQLGYQQVMANFRSEYTNRVLFLTDGVGDSQGILDMAESYKQMGVNVSTIGVGTDFDLALMNELAKRGGGSSRFIADRESMEKTFGEELDRMIVPAVRDVQMTLELAPDVRILETWGYGSSISGQRISYSLPTLHHRDYETILTRVEIPPQTTIGAKELARFSLSYQDLEGRTEERGPYVLSVELVDAESPVAGFSDAMVLQSGTMLRFAESLITVGELYYSCRDEIEEINAERDRLWRAQGETQNVIYEDLSNDRIRSLERSVASKMQRALDITVDMKKEMSNARLRLDNQGFDDEIEILDSYIEILGEELEYGDVQVLELVDDVEISPPVEQRSLEEHLANLFREMMLDLRVKDAGVVAVSGFTTNPPTTSGLLDLLNEMAVVETARYDTLKVVERRRLDAVLEEQALALSDLIDTTRAIEVGKLLAADYIITGSVIEMAASVVIFGRIINVETGEVESVAQVIVAKDPDVRKLLAAAG